MNQIISYSGFDKEIVAMPCALEKASIECELAQYDFKEESGTKCVFNTANVPVLNQYPSSYPNAIRGTLTQGINKVTINKFTYRCS